MSSIATQGEKLTSLVIVLLTSEKLTSPVDLFHTLDCILNRMIVSTDFLLVIYLDTDYDSADVYYGYMDYCEFIFKKFFWIRIFLFILHVITCLGQDLRNYLMV